MNKKEKKELEELYRNLQEEAKLKNERRRRHDLIVMDQMMKVCSKEEISKLSERLENKKITEVTELLFLILSKLEETETNIERQSHEIKQYIEKQELDVDTRTLLVAQQKSTKTSIELLREEIEELHEVVKLIFDEILSGQNKKEE